MSIVCFHHIFKYKKRSNQPSVLSHGNIRKLNRIPSTCYSANLRHNLWKCLCPQRVFTLFVTWQPCTLNVATLHIKWMDTIDLFCRNEHRVWHAKYWLQFLLRLVTRTKSVFLAEQINLNMNFHFKPSRSVEPFLQDVYVYNLFEML